MCNQTHEMLGERGEGRVKMYSQKYRGGQFCSFSEFFFEKIQKEGIF